MMFISRPDGDIFAARAAPVQLAPQTQISVDEGDCCIVSLNGRLLGKVDPGRWQLQQLPFAGHLLNDHQGHKDFLFVLTRPFGPVRIGMRLTELGLQAQGGSPMVVADATVLVHDPMSFCQNMLGSGDPSDAAAWVQKQLTMAIRQAVITLGLNVDQLSPQIGAVSHAVASSVASSFEPLGLTFQQLSKLENPSGSVRVGEGGAGAVAGAPTDGRLQLLGKLAGKMEVDSSDEDISKWERFGLFVAADAGVIRHYSGAVPGWRWIARAAGPLLDQVGGWPTAPDGSYQFNFASEAEARAYYGALRQHALSSVSGLQAQDTRQGSKLNVPSAYAETLWLNGQKVLYLLYDRIEDMQALSMESGKIGIHGASAPSPNAPTPPIVTFKSKSDVLYLAAAKGPTGAAEHVVMVLSDKHMPLPTIPDGLPRAEWMSKFESANIQFPSNVMVVQWGRYAGTDVLANEDAHQPGASLAQKIGTNLGIPLQVSHESKGRLGGVPAAYAVRMETGSYSVHYYELTTEQHGNFYCCAISRDGAENFLPVTVGNAGGRKFGGLGVDEYAMLSVERDSLIMQMGPQAIHSEQMSLLCQRYRIPFTPGGLAGRIDEWEQYIQGDPAFSAQWATQRGIATMKLQGRNPSEADIAALAQHQNAVEQQLKAHADKLDAIRDAAIQIIQHGAGRTPEDLLMMVKQLYGQFSPEDLFYKALRILGEPEEYGRFDTVQAIVEPLARAHYQVMTPEDQKYNGSADKYFKEKRESIYSSNDIELPAGFFGKLFG